MEIQQPTNSDLQRLAGGMGLTLVHHAHGPKGFWQDWRRRISTQRGLTIAEYRSTLSHELAHAYYRDTPTRGGALTTSGTACGLVGGGPATHALARRGCSAVAQSSSPPPHTTLRSPSIYSIFGLTTMKGKFNAPPDHPPHPHHRPAAGHGDDPRRAAHHQRCRHHR